MSEENISPKPKPESATKAGKKISRKKRRTLINLILIIIVIAALALFAWAEQQRRDAIKKLEQTAQELEEIREISQQTGAEVTKTVLENVKKHMDLVTDPEPTVATITNIEALRETNPFYERADNGDHLIITNERAVLYDPDRDIIIDVLPVKIEQTNTDATPTAEPEAGAGNEPPAQEEQAPQNQPNQPQ